MSASDLEATYVSQARVNQAIRETRRDLLILELELSVWLEEQTPESYENLPKSGREILFERFDNYNPYGDDDAPCHLLETLFGNSLTDINWESHFLASDYILEIWERKNKLAKTTKPNKQNNQTAWLKLRRRVFERDGYKCQKCGTQKTLCAHHVIPVGENPALKYEINNVITLCRKCHAVQHPKMAKLILGRGGKQ